MNKSLLVAKREYISTVRRKGFIITTFGLPVFIFVFGGIIGVVTTISARQTRAKLNRVGIFDESGIVRFELLNKIVKSAEDQKYVDEDVPPVLRDRLRTEAKELIGKTEITAFKSMAEAKEAFLRKDVRGYYVVPADFLQKGAIRLEIKKGGFMADNNPGWDLVRRLVTASLVEGKLDSAVAQRIWSPARLESQALNDQGQPDRVGQYSRISSFALPYAFAIFFMLSIMSSAGYLMLGVSEEKENRVIEVLISSVTPNQLLAGKILGLGGASLTQVIVWIVMGFLPVLQVLPFIDLRWDQLITAVIFFPLGFLLFGSLMGGTAALGNNFRESQQASMVWTMSSTIPFFLMTSVLAQPNGTVARVLSYFPLTAPITMMMRVGATKVPWWDISLSAAILLAGLFFFIRLAARLFRMGTLMYGKKPTLVEIVRWLRAS